MRASVLRLLFLLISANVGYGTRGDFYAEEVQALINSSDYQTSYRPDVNSDLFAFSRPKETKKGVSLSPNPDQKLTVVDGTVQSLFNTLSPNRQLNSLYHNRATSSYYILTISRIIFPFHFFL